ALAAVRGEPADLFPRVFPKHALDLLPISRGLSCSHDLDCALERLAVNWAELLHRHPLPAKPLSRSRTSASAASWVPCSLSIAVLIAAVMRASEAPGWRRDRC